VFSGIAIARKAVMATQATTFPISPISPISRRAGRKKKAAAQSPDSMSDHALARQAAEGDMACFEQLYTRHNRRVYSLCLRMTGNVPEAEDLA
jgi:RNA polymerase sigma-70 factor (ECF subfamily)